MTIDDFAKKYHVPVKNVEAFFRMLKIDPEKTRDFEEEKMKMFLPMMRKRI